MQKSDQTNSRKWPSRLPVAVLATAILAVIAYQVWYQVSVDPTRPVALFLVETILFGIAGPALAWYLFAQLAKQQVASELAVRQLDASRTQERYLLHAVSSSADAIIGLDPHDCIVTWNRAAEVLFSYTAGEALGRPITMVFQAGAAGETTWSAMKAQLNDTGAMRGYEILARSRSDRNIPVEVTHTAVRDEEGRLLGSALILRDTSHRKALAAEEQRRSQELATLYAVTAAMNAAMTVDQAVAQALDRVLEVLHLGSGKVYLLDHETKQLTLVAAQGEMLEFMDGGELTIAPGECLCGMAVTTGETLLSPDVINDQRIVRTDCLRHGHSACAAVPLLAREQMLGVLHVAAPDDTPFTRSGIALLRSVGAQIGVTMENMRLREEARRVEALSTLIQEMHHRIKNNLQTVADLLSLEMSATTNPEARKSLRDSISRIKSIAAVHQLLSSEQLRMTDITELARQVCGISQRHLVLPDRQIVAEVSGPAIYLPSKQATALALVMNELVTNAFEHAFQPGQPGQVRIILEQSAGQVSVSIVDNGRGLPPNFNVETDTGLGLQIVRTLVEKDLAGKLHFSRPDEGGSCITLTFYK